MRPDAAAKLEHLISKEDLHELCMRYCRAADRTDVALWNTVFHSDATCDLGDFFRGKAWEFAERFFPIMRERFIGTHHFIGNERFIIDGDYAEGEISLFSLKALESNPRQAELLTARYLDRYERRDGEWRILHRQSVLDPWEVQHFGKPGPNAWGENQFTTGTNDFSDPSFKYDLIGDPVSAAQRLG